MKSSLWLVTVFTVLFSLSSAIAADSGTVACQNQACHERFPPEANKASWWDAMIVGGSSGAVAGAAGGAYVGAGTGVAIGGVGAIPGWYVGTAIGAIGGGTVGAITAF